MNQPMKRTLASSIVSTSNSSISYLHSRGLVLICMDSYDSETRRIFQHFSRSTRFAFLCNAPNSENLQKKVNCVCVIFSKIRNFFLVNFVVFRTDFDEKMSEFHEIGTKY